MSYTQDTVNQISAKVMGKYFFGSPDLLEILLVAYLSRGHVLIEGPPGTGKTLSSKLLAEILAKNFKRIQFTSDMLPADILGAHIYSPKSRTSALSRDRSFPISFWLMKSIAPRPARSPRCLRRWRKGRSPSKGRSLS